MARSNACLLVNRAAIVVGVQVGIERDGAVVVGNGAIVDAFGLIGVTAVGEEVCLRPQIDCLVVVGDGVVVVALGCKVQAAIVVKLRLLGIEFDCGVVVGDGLVEVPERFLGGATIGEGAGILRVELDGLIEV